MGEVLRSPRLRRLVPPCVTLIALLTATTGCRRKDATADADAGEESADSGAGELEAIEAGTASADGGVAGPQIAALLAVTPVFSATEFPPKDPTKASEERQGVYRLGYLRRGQLMTVKPNVIKKSNCAEGWFELASGGFVCGKYATTDLSHKELQTAPHPPLEDSPLPYEYGLNLTNGTPLYRRRPFKKERAEFEKGLAVGKTKKREDGKPEKSSDEGGEKAWYQKDHGGKRPLVTMDELATNEGGGLVALRMVRGFYLSIDKTLTTPAGKFVRTTAGLLAPADHILIHKTKTEFEGVRIGAPGEARHLPLGWVVGPRVRRYRFDAPEGDTKTPPKRGDTIDRFTILPLTGKTRVAEDRVYYEMEDGGWLRDIDAAVAKAATPPAGLAPDEKWIDVNLRSQTLVAYEGDKPVYATIVSTGRHDDVDKTKDHRTVKGTFRIREKHVAATMDDDNATDGPYSIQDVPWIMYFEGSYALHGAFWHSSFGRERSHGCVNLQPYDAKQIFNWVGPVLPAGFHGVSASKNNPGTIVNVHD